MCWRRVLQTLGIFAIGAMVGTFAGALVGAFLLSSNLDGRAPGDGFIILFCLSLGFVLALPVSTLLAVWNWYRFRTRG
jgi:hypothetical protein